MNDRKARINRALRFAESDDLKVTAPSAAIMSNGRIKAGQVLVPPSVFKTMVWALRVAEKYTMSNIDETV